MNTDALAWTQAFILSDEEKHMLTDPEWIYPDLIVRGHIVAIVAEPNGGKTTILQYVAGEIAKDCRVVYVNADVAATDAKRMLEHADDHGYQLLLPDMKPGLSMDDVVQQLVRMNDAPDANYKGVVMFFDTLKKMCDVINKTRAKQLYKVLRGLSSKGLTIALAAHTNKYNDANGKPIVEGTADLRSDIDELIYLIPKKNADGTLTVSTDPDKVRADVKPITFEIDPDRNVRRLDAYVDTAAVKCAETQREKDETVIEAICETIRAGKAKQTEIVQECNRIAGRPTIERVLRTYSKAPVQIWRVEKGFKANVRIYSLIDHTRATALI